MESTPTTTHRITFAQSTNPALQVAMVPSGLAVPFFAAIAKSGVWAQVPPVSIAPGCAMAYVRGDDVKKLELVYLASQVSVSLAQALAATRVVLKVPTKDSNRFLAACNARGVLPTIRRKRDHVSFELSLNDAVETLCAYIERRATSARTRSIFQVG